jgi:hypothetical protein
MLRCGAMFNSRRRAAALFDRPICHVMLVPIRRDIDMSGF